MSKVRRFVTAGGTVLCALGIGYLMQSTSEASSNYPEDEKHSKATDRPSTSLNDGELQISDVILTSAATIPSKSLPLTTQFSDDPVVLAAAPASESAEVFRSDKPAPACESSPDLSATPLPAAMVKLTLSAPCLINERFTVHHNGMMFSDVTDDAGNSELTIPALAEHSVFIVSFAGNGGGAVTSTGVASLELYNRVVVQWRGNSGLQIHALEYGADNGDTSHGQAKEVHDFSNATLGEGGFLTHHGTLDIDNPLLAQVYTFPSGMAARESDVRLSVEAEVTAENCGRDVEVQTIQTNGVSRLKVKDLLLAIPACDAIGDFLVLNNMFNNLNIAQN